MIEITVRPGERINLGRQGENRARRIVFDVAQWEQIFGGGTVYLLHQRKGDEAPYPVTVERDGNKVYWVVGSADVACPGSGLLELQYRKEDVIVKSEEFHTKTWHSLDEAGEHPGDPEEGWVEQVLASAQVAGEDAVKSVASAQEAKKSAEQAGAAETNAKASETAAQAAADQAEDAQRKAEEAAERAEAAAEQSGSTGGGVGRSLAGELVILPDGSTMTAQEGAEIFNDYEGNAAVGSFSHAEGTGTTASGAYAHAEGQKSKATGDCAHAEGSNTTASGMFSHAEGQVASARGDYSHAEGQFSTTDGRVAHAEGHRTYAKGDYSHAEGYYTMASGEGQHVQGKANVEDTENKYAHIVGNGVNGAKRSNAHTLDWNGLGWFAGGLKVGGTGQDDPNAKTVATLEDLQGAVGGTSAPAILDVLALPTENIDETVFYRIPRGAFVSNQGLAGGVCYIVEGLPAVGEPVTADGQSVNAGYYNTLDKDAYGYLPDALASAVGVPSGWYPFSALAPVFGLEWLGVVGNILDCPEGNSLGLLLEGNVWYHQYGWRSINAIGQSGEGDFAEVFNHPSNVARGLYSHAEGRNTTASGNGAHAEGFETAAYGDSSHTEGLGTVANGDCQHVQGRYNMEDTNGKYLHIVGNGESYARSNAHTLDRDGNAWFAGGIELTSPNGTRYRFTVSDDGTLSAAEVTS